MNRALRTQGAPAMAGMEGGYGLLPIPATQSSRGFGRRWALWAFATVLTVLVVMTIESWTLNGPGGIRNPTQTNADLIALREALSTYEVQTGNLPTTEQGLRVLWEKPTTPPIPDEWHKVMPGELYDQWGNPYQYRNPGLHNPKGYDLFSMGPDGIAGTADDIGNWPPVPSEGGK